MHAKTYVSTELNLITFLIQNFLLFWFASAECEKPLLPLKFWRRVAPWCSLSSLLTMCLEIPFEDHAGETSKWRTI